MMDSFLERAAMAAAILLIGVAGLGSAVADEKYDKESFESDCEMVGGAYIDAGSSVACDFKSGEDIICDSSAGGVSDCMLGWVVEAKSSSARPDYRSSARKAARPGRRWTKRQKITLAQVKRRLKRPTARLAQLKQPPRMKPRFKPGLKRRLPRRVCPDPAAYRLTFRIVSRTSRTRGRVEIAGIVKNVGGAPYVTRAGQQGIQLWEGSRMVRNLDFRNLTPGQSKTVRYRRNWNSASPSEGEFPPTYKLWIIYDPDITKDGNRRNDDCRGSNNRIQRSGQGINTLLR